MAISRGMLCFSGLGGVFVRSVGLKSVMNNTSRPLNGYAMRRRRISSPPIISCQQLSTSTAPTDLDPASPISTSVSAIPSDSATTQRNIIDVLQERGLFDSGTGDLDVLKKHCSVPCHVYAGFDPTADSLHLGNLLALITLKWFQLCGHKVTGLIGGATGRVGDPSGKNLERPILSEEVLRANERGIEENIRRILSSSEGVNIVNNYTWFSGISFLDFLRDVGKFVRVSTMLSKDSVKNRLDSTEGISYTEFTYQLLQAYDFMHLNDAFDVSVQLGGSDQWGNITAGTELTRKLRAGKAVHGVTFPLLTTADGKKFGKSENGAIWLAKTKLSEYDFYQYLFKTADKDVVNFLKKLTFLPMSEIDAIEKNMSNEPPNYAQKILAGEVTKLVHGADGVKLALEITENAKPGGKTTLTKQNLEAGNMPSVTLAREQVVGNTVVNLLVAADLAKSKGEARRLVKNGGAYLNNEKVGDEKATVAEENLVEDCMLLLGAGKKKKMVVRISE